MRRTPRINHVSAADAKSHIARAFLHTPNETDAQLGSITLLAYQREGVARLLALIERHGGALLADEVGLGKTYTALGVARRFQRVEIVAPAALRSLWNEACSRCAVAAAFVSAESLSRADVFEQPPELLIVDEAHWFRNAATLRYRRLARRCRRANVLLLTATPLHNRPRDLTTLIALFQGARTRRLAPNDLTALIVRRGRQQISEQLSEASPPPRVLPTVWRRVPCDKQVVAALAALDPPIPPRDGALALALLRMTLLRRFSSSHAALRSSLRRMLARGLAMLEAARTGRHPTARELCGWLVAEDTIQLELPDLFGAAPNEHIQIQDLERHIGSVRAALDTLAQSDDSGRARVLQSLLQRFPGARIVAFSQYAATVQALGRELRTLPGIAVLSSRSARIASGPIPRAELLEQFDAQHARRPLHSAMKVRLLLTTDLLSEGVNLHNAEVIVHLDLPWTSARLEQRVGRLSRVDSPHQQVHVFGFAPPIDLERAQRNVARIRAKLEASRRRFGDHVLLADDALVGHNGRSATSSSRTHDQEALRSLVAGWLGERRETPTPFAAHVRGGSEQVALALMQAADGYKLVALRGHRVTMHPRTVLDVARLLTTAPECSPPHDDRLYHAWHRFRRFVAQRRAAFVVRRGPALAALYSAIARATRSVTRNERPLALEFGAAIRVAVQRVHSAGDQVLLDELSRELLNRQGRYHALAWLEIAAETLSKSFPPPARMVDATAHRLIGILLST